jgi:hypothetical protein
MDRVFTRVLERQSTYIYYCDQKSDWALSFLALTRYKYHNQQLNYELIIHASKNKFHF